VGSEFLLALDIRFASWPRQQPHPCATAADCKDRGVDVLNSRILLRPALGQHLPR
jgi:hypothetical protein